MAVLISIFNFIYCACRGSYALPYFLPACSEVSSVLAALIFFPAVVFCSVVPGAAATDKDSKVPEKPEAIISVSETLKPLSTQGKAVVDVDISIVPSTTLRANEESDAILNRSNSIQPDFSVEGSIVLDFDIVLLPQPLNHFTL